MTLTSQVASVASVTFLLLVSQACARRPPMIGDLACTPTLIVHNNSGQVVDVHEHIAGASTVLATVGPGTYTFPLTTADPRASYGVTPAGGREILTAKNAQRWRGPLIRLERVCA